ncbi:Uncharacterised protein [Streptococcus pneumoniae]|nr:Uncharacterised protein [Streptococcus pneumoniae]
MDYIDAIEKVGILEITIGVMELFPGMKEQSNKATKSIRKTKVYLEKEDWVAAVASLDEIHDFVREYRERLPKTKIRDDYTLDSLEKNIAVVEGFLARQIREESGESCPDSQRISSKPKQTSVIRLRKSLKLRS